MDKTKLYESIENNESTLRNIAQKIWENPELGLQEEYASELLRGFLEENGFDVQPDIGGLPTAFIAKYGSDDPQIGILGEYDALPGLSQRAKSIRDPFEEGAPGHGCGHNLYGTACAGAAIAVKQAIQQGNINGTIIFFGCPAEETLIGKPYMAREGVFDDLDAALTWHPSHLSTPRMRSSNALNSIMFTFDGISSHAAGSPESGRSALDAVELMNTGVEYMREHVSDQTRIHYVITEGGKAPNVVPSEATVWYYVRAPDRAIVGQVSQWLRDIADGAAEMTQTKVSERLITGCYNYLSNQTLTDVIWKNMRNLSPIDYDRADYEFASELKSTIPEEQVEANLSNLPESLYEEIRGEVLHPDPVEVFDQKNHSPGSTDVGDVSWIVPTGEFRAAVWPVGSPGHSWQVVAANGDFAKKGIGFAAKVLAGTTHDLLTDTDTLRIAREEFEEKLGSRSYESPLPDQIDPPFDITRDHGS